MLSGSMAVDDYAAANLKLPDISANITGRNWRKNVEKQINSLAKSRDSIQGGGGTFDLTQQHHDALTDRDEAPAKAKFTLA